MQNVQLMSLNIPIKRHNRIFNYRNVIGNTTKLTLHSKSSFSMFILLGGTSAAGPKGTQSNTSLILLEINLQVYMIMTQECYHFVLSSSITDLCCQTQRDIKHHQPDIFRKPTPLSQAALVSYPPFFNPACSGPASLHLLS